MGTRPEVPRYDSEMNEVFLSEVMNAFELCRRELLEQGSE